MEFALGTILHKIAMEPTSNSFVHLDTLAAKSFLWHVSLAQEAGLNLYMERAAVKVVLLAEEPFMTRHERA